MPWLLLSLSALLFAVVSGYAWAGRMGLTALVLVVAAGALFALGRRALHGTAKARVDLTGRVVFTIVGMMSLLRHPIKVEGLDDPLPLYAAIGSYLGEVNPQVFVRFALAAMAVKFVGVLLSSFAWHLMLRGQGIQQPYWGSTVTAFLIGRFIGTFAPSTLGLDGYTLYEAARYSGQGSRAVTAKGAEKILGLAGRAPGFLIALPFSYGVVVTGLESFGAGERAPQVYAFLFAALSLLTVAVLGSLAWPTLPQWGVALMSRISAWVARFLPAGPHIRVLDAITALLAKVARDLGAFRGQIGLLLTAFVAKGLSSFATWVVYYLTGLAIGVAALEFWPVVFGSGIQEIGTLLSPTIAGEGAREAFQALLLSKQYGGTAQAVLAGAVGFVAAEAATLWGGVFLFTRGPGYRPAFCRVDGVQVDYAWLEDEDGAVT